MRSILSRTIVSLTVFMTCSSLMISAEAQSTPTATNTQTYQKAPAPLDQILDLPSLPAIRVSPDNQKILLLEQRSLPSLAELAEPELRLAGLRFNPTNYAPSRAPYAVGLKLHINGKIQNIQGLPAQVRISDVVWSPDSKYVAFVNTTADQSQLWLLDAKSAKIQHLKGIQLNQVYGTNYVWAPDSQSLIIKSPAPTGPKPPEQALPQGPIIQESSGKASPGRTYQDLLKSPQDETRFAYYLQSQLQEISLQGKVKALGAVGLLSDFSISPDGKYLLVQQLHTPFSYAFPAFRFPLLSQVWDRTGKTVKTIADQPLADNIPIDFDAVRSGPRELDWRSDAPASLYWFEALDQGDPTQKLAEHDQLLLWPAPFSQAPFVQLKVPHRLNRVYWGNDKVALASSDWYQTRQASFFSFVPMKPISQEVLSYSSEDRYLNPGTPLETKNAQGKAVLLMDTINQTILLSGEGASPEGDRPFLNRFDLNNKQSQEIWRSQAPYYEQLVKVLDPMQGTLLTRRETTDTPANYFWTDINTHQHQALTDFKHPLPAFAKIQKQIIEYERADGVKLNATLYLPPGYEPKQGPLPTVLWAYPREFKNAAAASQIQGSPYSFVNLSAWSPLIFLTQGYAVLDRASMPIIGEGESEPNDTYVKQLVADAQAAVDKVVAMGVTDRNRIGVGGHSYGAFMTANLLTHSDLFKAGIARSGAYNRTLTPFGFQSEQRTLWQAADVYLAMSPLMYAHQLKEPLLMIHGEADNNAGTHPMQSQYYFQAIKGLGGNARLVILPYESHGYQARESMHHMLWEMVSWFDQHVKNHM